VDDIIVVEKDKFKNESLDIKLILKSILIFIVFIAITFILAGRIDYW
jgi:hypothetical protein